MKTKLFIFFAMVTSIACGASTNDALRLSTNVVDLGFTSQSNTNWIGKTVQEILEGKEINQIIVVEREYSQAPLKHLTQLLRDVWTSKTKAEPRPPADRLIGTPVIFLVITKDGTPIKVQFKR